MDGLRPVPPPQRAIKRTRQSPWNVPMQNKSPSTQSLKTPVPAPRSRFAPGRSASASNQGSASSAALRPSYLTENNDAKMSARPERIVSDIVPEVSPRKMKPNGLATNPKIKAIQMEWEKKQKLLQSVEAPVQSRTVSNKSASETSSSASPSHSSSFTGSTDPMKRLPASVGRSSPATQSNPTTVTPVPVPTFGASRKRRIDQVDESPEPSRVPAQRIEEHSVSSPAVNVDDSSSSRIDEAKRLTEAAVSQEMSDLENSQHMTPAALTKQPLYAELFPGALDRVSREIKYTNKVKVNGKIFEVMTHIKEGDRRYDAYKEGDKLQSACGAVLPENYSLLDEPEARFVCPVRDCQRRLNSIRALGGHMCAAHPVCALNDNLDGTFSILGKCSKVDDRAPALTNRAVVVSQIPISPSAPPPVEPTMSFANQLRESASRRKPQVPIKTLPATDAHRLASSRVLKYLHTFLSQKQIIPDRPDILWMAKMERRRELPNSWIFFHQGDILDTENYACALTYLIGQEVTARVCTKPPSTLSPEFSDWRLSEKCISLPPKMYSVGQDIGRYLTCVGCQYRELTHPEAKKTECNFSHRAAKAAEVPSAAVERSQETIRVGTSDLSMSDAEPSKSATESDTSDDEAPKPKRDFRPRKETGAPPRPIRDFRAPMIENNTHSTPVLKAGNGNSEDDTEEMEKWEFAPGKQLSKTRHETIALSASYLDGPQPITLSDDISFHRITLVPGGSTHFNADYHAIRYCEVILGKVHLIYLKERFSIGQGGLFVIRPGMSCTVENRRYTGAILSCHTNANYSLLPDTN